MQDYNGDLTIYHYDASFNNTSLVQDKIPAYYGFAMSSSHLAVADFGGSVSISHRDQNYEPFEFVEKLPVQHDDGLLAIDENVLVVGGQDQTTIYQISSDWKKVTTINESYYDYHLRDNVLLAIQENLIDSYNLEGCLADVGQAPPVSSPTSPTLSPTVATSSHIYDSDCIEVDLRLEYNNGCPTSVSWKLWRVTGERIYTLAASYNETNVNATGSMNHLCLSTGEYSFGIFINRYRCPYSYYYGVSYYEARESDYGNLLLLGGDVTVDETQRFSIH